MNTTKEKKVNTVEYGLGWTEEKKREEKRREEKRREEKRSEEKEKEKEKEKKKKRDYGGRWEGWTLTVSEGDWLGNLRRPTARGIRGIPSGGFEGGYLG